MLLYLLVLFKFLNLANFLLCCLPGANDTSVTLSQVNPTPTLQMPKSKNLSSDMKEDKLRWQKEGNEDKPRKADGRVSVLS